MKILVINGSYREDGVTDSATACAVNQLEMGGYHVEQVVLRDTPIKFCLNCRQCMLEPGEHPGHCVQDDAMAEIIDRIESADAYILAAPVNFGSVTAVFKRFMERLAVYGYWPEGQKYPLFRKEKQSPKKKALIISSSAAPGLLAQMAFSSVRQLKSTANLIGARPVGTVFVGFADKARSTGLRKRQLRELVKSTQRLVA